MKKNSLYKLDSKIYRVLYQQEDRVMVIDCIKMTVPVWISNTDMEDYSNCEEEELLQVHDVVIEDVDEIEADRKQVMYQRYTMVAGVLPFISDSQQRSVSIDRIATEYGQQGFPFRSLEEIQHH